MIFGGRQRVHLAHQGTGLSGSRPVLVTSHVTWMYQRTVIVAQDKTQRRTMRLSHAWPRRPGEVRHLFEVRYSAKKTDKRDDPA